MKDQEAEFVSLSTLAMKFDTDKKRANEHVEMLRNAGYQIDVAYWGSSGVKKVCYPQFRKALLDYSEKLAAARKGL